MRPPNTEDILSLLFFKDDDPEKIWTAEKALELLQKNGYKRSIFTVTAALSRLSYLNFKRGCRRRPVVHRFDRGKYKVSEHFLKANKEVYAPWCDANAGVG
jgi:hypothetical protein